MTPVSCKFSSLVIFPEIKIQTTKRVEGWAHKETSFSILEKQDTSELKGSKKMMDVIQSHLASITKLGTSPGLVQSKC